MLVPSDAGDFLQRPLTGGCKINDQILPDSSESMKHESTGECKRRDLASCTQFLLFLKTFCVMFS